MIRCAARERLLLLLVLVPIQIARAHQEAKVLEARFGDEYRNYRKGTWLWRDAS